MLGRQPDIEVVGEAKNGLEAVDSARSLKPDVTLMDLRMPELDGVQAMLRIHEEVPDARFIVLTTFDTDEYIFDAIDAGAKGYLLKDVSREELFRAVRAVHRGESLIQPGVAAKVLDRLASLSRQNANQVPAEGLSEREVEVLGHMAKGAANKENSRGPVNQRKHRQDARRKHLYQARRQSQGQRRSRKAVQKGIISL